MAYVQIEGFKIYFVEKGSGAETILLVHGNVSSTEYWKKFLGPLPPRYRAIALDLRGCGQTEHPPDGYNIPQFVEDLEKGTVPPPSKTIQKPATEGKTYSIVTGAEIDPY